MVLKISVSWFGCCRAPDGCPWDSVKPTKAFARNFLEEVYEACEAIDQKDPVHLREELGDVLLHVVFHAGIEADAGNFTIDDVCDTVVKKMISRHPALFGGEQGLDWDEISAEKRARPLPQRAGQCSAQSACPVAGREATEKSGKGADSGGISGGICGSK